MDTTHSGSADINKPTVRTAEDAQPASTENLTDVISTETVVTELTLWQQLTLSNIKQLLLNHYTAPMETIFKQFRLGLSLFFCGMVVVYGSHQALAPSLHQEVMVLVGLVVVGIGFIMAMLAQIRLIISRFLLFFLNKPED